MGTYLNSYLDSDFSSHAVFPPPKFFFAVSTIPCGERVGMGLRAAVPVHCGATLAHLGVTPAHGGDPGSVTGPRRPAPPGSVSRGGGPPG